MSGYTRLDGGKGKARLLAVDPLWRRRGIGEQLHRLRMRALWDVGCKVIVSYTDRPPLAHWLCLRFRYEEVLREPKRSPGPKPARPGPPGADAVLDEWIVLECDFGLGGNSCKQWPVCAGGSLTQVEAMGSLRCGKPRGDLLPTPDRSAGTG